ncbi:MAG: membrane protein insertase YidC, partial [Pseudomonadota bacterium]
MDIQRALLIGAVVLLSFMLLQEWVSFKAAKEAPARPEARLTAEAGAPATATEPDSASPASDLPPLAPVNDSIGNQPAEQSGGEDLPTLAASQDPAADRATDTAGSAAIVQVYTDTLQLAIDLNGGDIVEVALPKFRAKIDNPDVPFVLLENNTQRAYVAQSGLIGRNGIDSSGRAQYRSSALRYDLGDDDQLNIDLVYAGDADVSVIKSFTFTRDSYLVDVSYDITNQGSERWQGNLFGQLKRDSSPAPESDNGGMGMQPFLGAATTTPDD